MSADLRLKPVGLVQRSVACARHSGYVDQMNWVNSHIGSAMMTTAYRLSLLLLLFIIIIGIDITVSVVLTLAV